MTPNASIVLEHAVEAMERGRTIYFKWTCVHCHARQTFDTPNRCFISGKCEECGRITHVLEEEGAFLNYLMIAKFNLG